jgi:hypothetical protein
VPGNDGEIDGATIGDFTYGTGPAAFRQTAEQVQSGGIAKTFEKLRIEKIVDWAATVRRLFRRQRPSFAYLRHYASIGAVVLFVN